MNATRRLVLAYFSVLACLFAITLSVAPPAYAQATTSTGSIQGTITDPSGSVVPGASVTITNKGTGQTVRLTTTATGTYSSGALLPGIYGVRAEAPSFKTTEETLTVQVGVATPGNLKLELGAGSTVVTVTQEDVQVNTEQPTVQGVMTREQIENFPVNGRNFLELAQLEPGVQIQDGGNFDPTKNGYSSISFGGRFGRTARIEVDGIDISDETVGTTTQNIPASAIDQFQLSQSSLDLSTELTSSGAVNVTTRAGSNVLHGGAYFYDRNDGLAEEVGPFLRHQYGVSLGGPFYKDKLFFFATAERTRQDLEATVLGQSSFPSGSFTSPFRDLELLGRVDWQVRPSWNIFYRFSYEQNRNVSTFIPNTFQPFANVDHTPVHVVGTNFNTGSFSHSIRFGYTKFRNAIVDAVVGSKILNPAPGIAIAIGGDQLCLTAGADSFCSGANFLAPQGTYQQNTQFKYDGSKTIRSHVIRFGFGYNRIVGGGFASFIGTQPIAASFGTCNSTCLALAGGASNPLNYTVDAITLGNGQGFFTELPAFGLKGGGQLDHRLQWYLGDSWKMLPNLTFNYGVRYVRDTGRTNNDLAPIPCSAAATPPPGCTGNLIDQFGSGLGGRTNQPNHNYGGNIGIAWDPWKSGKTVIRAGAGIYYENAIFNNVLFDRPVRLQKGLFNTLAFLCPSGPTLPGTSSPLPTINGKDIATKVCTQPIGSVINDVIDLQNTFVAATLAAGAQSNSSFIGNTLADGSNSTGNNLLYPGYVSPYSFQANAGIERQLFPGTVLKVDYVRNVNLHYLLTRDTNHVGDARFFNLGNAQAAVATTLADCGVTTISAGIANCPGVPMSTTQIMGRGLNLADFASRGLDSGNSFASGGPCPTCAFPGINPNVGQNQMAFPVGRAVYNGLQVSLQSQVKELVQEIHHANFIISYSYSRYVSQVRDSDFISSAPDYAASGKFIGPNGLDRTHQLSAGGVFDLPWWTRISLISHYTTALPVTLQIPGSPFGGTTAGIFTSDLTGDGAYLGSTRGGAGDLLPGTNIGSFNHGVDLNGLNKLISSYNTSVAGTFTPAGQVLVSNGIFTPAQLVSLGGVVPTIQPVVPGAVHTTGLFTVDMRLGWVIRPNRWWKRLSESLQVEPQIAFFNLFNHFNYDSPSQPPNGILQGCPVATLTCAAVDNGTAVNSTTVASRTNRVGLGSGVFSLGAPRQIEYGIKVTF
ncbi:MAG: TonB-dependent receptor [Acidipila sp.]|nr:TonB-dependent receptor [Acidipila sp.]